MGRKLTRTRPISPLIILDFDSAPEHNNLESRIVVALLLGGEEENGVRRGRFRISRDAD